MRYLQVIFIYTEKEKEEPPSRFAYFLEITQTIRVIIPPRSSGCAFLHGTPRAGEHGLLHRRDALLGNRCRRFVKFRSGTNTDALHNMTIHNKMSGPVGQTNKTGQDHTESGDTLTSKISASTGADE